MITIKNVSTISGEVITHTIKSEDDITIDGSGLTLFPGLIDPHVHFRTPGQEYKEDWRTAALATVKGGYTTVFDMPNNIPPCISDTRLKDKKALIDKQLSEAGIPLRYELYIGADKNHFEEIPKVAGDIVGIKVFMGSSTGELLMDDENSLRAMFQIAAMLDLVVGLHAEDECMIQENNKKYAGRSDHLVHASIRSPEVAASAVKLVIDLVRQYGTKAYILHVSSSNELDLIRAAKEEGLPVFAETSPHHMFMNVHDLEKMGGLAQMNPALRAPEHQEAIFAAIKDGTIDTLGSDHAPHTIEEKNKPYPESPSGVPGIETNLPLLLNAYNQGKLSLDEILDLTHANPRKIFEIRENDDVVLVDLNKKKTVKNEDQATKCGWSPFDGWELTGWPVCTILKGKIFNFR